MHDIILLMKSMYGFQKMTNIVLVLRFAVYSEMFGELPEFSLLRVFHLQVKVDFVLECFMKFHYVRAFLIR